MDHICAMDKGYFRDEGLHIEVIRAPGGVATPGLLSGQFQFSSSASSAVSAAVRGGENHIYEPVATDLQFSCDKVRHYLGKRFGREKNRHQ
jgi:ABC-type nitrate/sulfonate/bicarbonate transport system substrate-binding protein